MAKNFISFLWPTTSSSSSALKFTKLSLISILFVDETFVVKLAIFPQEPLLSFNWRVLKILSLWLTSSAVIFAGFTLPVFDILTLTTLEISPTTTSPKYTKSGVTLTLTMLSLLVVFIGIKIMFASTETVVFWAFNKTGIIIIIDNIITIYKANLSLIC